MIKRRRVQAHFPHLSRNSFFNRVKDAKLAQLAKREVRTRRIHLRVTFTHQRYRADAAHFTQPRFEVHNETSMLIEADCFTLRGDKMAPFGKPIHPNETATGIKICAAIRVIPMWDERDM